MALKSLVSKKQALIKCSPSTLSQTVGKGEPIVMLIVFNKTHKIPKIMVVPDLGCQQVHWRVRWDFLLQSEVFPTSRSISRSSWKVQCRKTPFPYFHGLWGFSNLLTGLVSLSLLQVTAWHRGSDTGQKMQLLAASHSCPSSGTKGKMKSYQKSMKHKRLRINYKSPICWWLSSLKEKLREK